jgi:hypothetical protein
VSEDEIAGDSMRDALAFIEAVARDDEQGAAVILDHADLRALARCVAELAVMCAIQGAAFDGPRVSPNTSREEVLAVRDDVLLRIRQGFEYGGLI